MIISHRIDISAEQAAPVSPRPPLCVCILSYTQTCPETTFNLFPSQVCGDGLLLGSGPGGEAQVPAAGSVPDRVPRCVGCLRLNIWTSFIRRTCLKMCLIQRKSGRKPEDFVLYSSFGVFIVKFPFYSIAQ